MLILLTKIDTYDPDIIGEDLKKTFHSARLQSLMEVSAKYAYAFDLDATNAMFVMYCFSYLLKPLPSLCYSAGCLPPCYWSVSFHSTMLIQYSITSRANALAGRS